MAIYTIEINERTVKGKALRTFLECEDVVKIRPLSDRDDLLVKEIARGLMDVLVTCSTTFSEDKLTPFTGEMADKKS